MLPVTSKLSVAKLTGSAAPSEIESDRWMTSCNTEVHSESPNDFKDDSKVSRIHEQLIQGKSFSH